MTHSDQKDGANRGAPRGGAVKRNLTLFWLAGASPCSSEVQQPMRATAVLSRHPRTRYAASLDREQGRADSLHPDACIQPDNPRISALALPGRTWLSSTDAQSCV